jgi:NAD(P)-dependent dehydrogenase (short-subunit alcohol dehydrogenase family)
MSASPTASVFSQISAPSLAGRVALITGASSGIGAATARLFSLAGASLVIHGRDQTRLDAVAAEIKAKGGKVVTLIGDAAKEETHKQLVALALKTYGALHIAFNNAGVAPFAPLTAITGEQVDYVLDTNVKGVVYALKHQMPAIGASSSKDNWGVIIQNSSIVSQRIRAGPSDGAAVYSATKSAVDTLTRFGALEGAAKFVRVNSINPGFTASEGAQKLMGGAENFDKVASSAGLIGPAQPDEIAQSVLFLADSKTGRFFTGSIVNQDGGFNVA